MDRQIRRRGHWANLTALAGPERAHALATVPLHITQGIRRGINNFGHVCDELLYRGWRDVEIRRPLYIVAPARSGTTMLFHQLAADPQFAATTLGNTLIRPISVTRLLRRMAAKQRKFILAARDSINQTMAALDDTHIVRIERLEEDEGFFNDQFSTFNYHLFFPTLYQKYGLIEFDDRPPRFQRRLMRRYRNFIRRFLYLSGGDRTYLCKNVQSASRMNMIEGMFPDARYVHIIRDPVIQLPSTLELMRSLTHGSHGRVWPPAHPYWRLVLDRLIEHHRRLLAWERKLPAARWLTLRYDDLIADPAASVRRIHAHFDIPLDPARAAELAGANERAGAFQKQRTYSLADYGVTPEYVREQLADVYDAYGLDGGNAGTGLASG